MGDGDTIAAVATPPGRGGVGIVRVSGPAVPAIAQSLLGCCPAPRSAEYRTFRDAAGETIDAGVALYFPAPRSFTGEEVLELQGHGGPVVMDLLLAAVLAAGARPAGPGEFTQRAYLNGKLDLAQAEAVADLIDSASTEAARSALRSLQGEFSERIHQLVERLIELRLYVESAIDFPEEEIDFLTEGGVGERLEAVCRSLEAVTAGARQGALIREGMTVVLAGAPNVGKSSLLNALAGSETAIVTEIPGTTRDLLREQIQIDGMPLHVVDTAGLRDSDDPVEREGIRRARAAIEAADRILLVIDDRDPPGAHLPHGLPESLPVTVVRNKIDLSGAGQALEEGGQWPQVRLCARGGEGLELLRDHLKRSIGYQGGEGSFMARRRHLEALRRAAEHLNIAEGHLAHGSGELLAEELRLAQQSLSEITGEFSAEELLERIFSSFCIGK